MSEPSNTNYFKKSSESLRKNSSSDTEYSLHPYKVVKQSSNETSTSLTGSFNVDHSSTGGGAGLEPSLDNTDVSESGLNNTVIEVKDCELKSNTNGSRPSTIDDEAYDGNQASVTADLPPMAPRSLKKQFSIDQGSKGSGRGKTHTSSLDDHLTLPMPPFVKSGSPCASPLSRGFHYLRESSSTSTEDYKDDRGHSVADPERKSPKPEQKVDDGKDNDPHFSETMC